MSGMIRICIHISRVCTNEHQKYHHITSIAIYLYVMLASIYINKNYILIVMHQGVQYIKEVPMHTQG